MNNFLTWSLSRHFLPFMSREYRAALQEFYSDIYGNYTFCFSFVSNQFLFKKILSQNSKGVERSKPIWYFCSKLLKSWMPFAVDGLQQNPRLIVVSATI